MPSISCPVCGHDIHDPDGMFMYDICTNCYWELDSFAAKFPSEWSDNNHTTLCDAQVAYSLYGACDPHGYWCKTGKMLIFEEIL